MSDPRHPINRTFEKLGLFDKPPTIEAGCQFVVLTRQHLYQAFPQGVQPRSADLRAALRIYEVRVAKDTAALGGAVASKADTFNFQLEGSVTYRVTNPVRLIEQSVIDTREEVSKLVRGAVNAVSRNWLPQQVQDAQAAVMRVVEGNRKAANRLGEAGYELLDLDIQLRREASLRDIAAETELERAKQALQKEQQAREIERNQHLRAIFESGIYARMAYLAAQGGGNLERAMADLTQYELQELQGQIQIIEAMAPQLQDHQQKKLLEDIRGKLNNRFSAARALQSESVRGALADPQASAPAALPPPDDY